MSNKEIRQRFLSSTWGGLVRAVVADGFPFAPFLHASTRIFGLLAPTERVGIIGVVVLNVTLARRVLRANRILLQVMKFRRQS